MLKTMEIGRKEFSFTMKGIDIREITGHCLSSKMKNNWKEETSLEPRGLPSSFKVEKEHDSPQIALHF